MGLRNRVPGNIWGAYWQCVVNMTELFMCSDNVALCQITLTMLVVVLIVIPAKTFVRDYGLNAKHNTAFLYNIGRAGRK